MCENNSWIARDIQQQNTQVLNEKVSEILAKLDSICYEETMLGKSEQFVLGVQASAEVVRSYFYGQKYKK
jgi:hypothetical protein